MSMSSRMRTVGVMTLWIVSVSATGPLTGCALGQEVASDTSWIAVRNWISPRDLKRGSPFAGGIQMAAGDRVFGAALTVTQMAGFDLMVQSLFSYRDGSGRRHPRDFKVSLIGLATFYAAIGISSVDAAREASRINTRERARALAVVAREADRQSGSPRSGVPGLGASETVRVMVRPPDRAGQDSSKAGDSRATRLLLPTDLRVRPDGSLGLTTGDTSLRVWAFTPPETRAVKWAAGGGGLGLLQRVVSRCGRPLPGCFIYAGVALGAVGGWTLGHFMRDGDLSDEKLFGWTALAIVPRQP